MLVPWKRGRKRYGVGERKVATVTRETHNIDRRRVTALRVTEILRCLAVRGKDG